MALVICIECNESISDKAKFFLNADTKKIKTGVFGYLSQL